MSCPFIAKAVVTGKDTQTTVVRLCMAIPRERENDPGDMPPPSVCSSDHAYTDCYHYKVMQLRGEPGVEQPEESLPNQNQLPAISPNSTRSDFEERRHLSGQPDSGK
jgi:hypothetical protein